MWGCGSPEHLAWHMAVNHALLVVKRGRVVHTAARDAAADCRQIPGMRVGLVSDTHGLVDPKLPDVLRGVDVILHAGDIVKPEILRVLGAVAPVRAVRGNNDEGLPAFARLPETALVELGALSLLLVHDLGARERPKPPARPLLLRHRPELVVHGHSHRPGVARVGDTLFVNPGSAGPRRFSLPRTAALLEVRGRTARVAFFDLAGDAAAPFGDPVEATL